MNILEKAAMHRRIMNQTNNSKVGSPSDGNKSAKKEQKKSWTDTRSPELIAQHLMPYTTLNPLIGLVDKGSHSFIFRTAQPDVVAKVEYQKGPGKLALLMREQGWMRQFTNENHLAHSLDVLWNVPVPNEPECKYNVIYMPFYPLTIYDLQKMWPLEFIATQLMEALAQLHKHGLVHRDVHPGNIRGRADGCLVLVDFGLTITLDTKTPRKKLTPVGTDPFISESVLAGNPYTFKDDYVSASKVIHSLGSPLTWKNEPCPPVLLQFMGLAN